MNGRPVTDAQISQALRVHLPERAQPGLRARVLDATRTTSQQRPLPSFLGALSDADPVNRRRNLLIAAALLVALAFASATAVGAWRLLQRDPVPELSLEPPADLPAFVLSSYERLPQLPPVALTWRDSDSTKGRIYVDRSGAVRFDQFASADAAEPSAYRVLSGNRISGVATVGSDKVWVDDDGAIENPREWIRGVLHGQDGPPGCEMERDPSDVGNGNAATGWRYVGLEYVAGRPTHHVTCVGDVWIDIETRLILRTQGPAVDDAGQPIPVESTEVTEIAFGEQPAALFEPPDGLARWSAGDYKAYICLRGLPNELVPGISDCPTAEAEATPVPEPSPTPSMRADPTDCRIPSRDPRELTGPLEWTAESLKEDWPAPVRPEPGGAASVQPMPLTYLDPTGDTGSNNLPCIDIRDVTVGTHEVFFNLGSNQPPDVEPSEAWIAYGVVVDDDRDGVPDRRFGIENPLRTADDPSSNHRVWRTDLDTGRTESAVDGDFSKYFSSGFTGGYPGSRNPDGFLTGHRGARFQFGREFDTTGGTKTRGFKLDMPFYTWASVIVNGRVVATDYAPDSGWLIATPGVPLTPLPPPRFPGGTYLIEELPIDLGWKDGGSLPLRVSINVPPDWTVGGPWGEGNVGLGFGVVGHPLDSCPDTNEPEPGPSFDDLVSHLEALPRIDISEIRRFTLDGHRAAYLEYKPVEGHFDCMSGSVIPLEAGTNQIWIVDVDDVRVVIAASSEEALSEGARSEVRQIVESIQIEP